MYFHSFKMKIEGIDRYRPSQGMLLQFKQWRILLQVFADQGIDLTNMDKIAIGLGSKGGASTGGSGTIYIDDVRLNQP